MAKAKFPIGGLFEAITSVSELVKEAIPSDELRQQQFDENAPLRKLKKMKELLRKSRRYFKQNGLTVDEVSEFAEKIGQDKAFETLLIKELTK